jgi:hypothetical protein
MIKNGLEAPHALMILPQAEKWLAPHVSQFQSRA